MCCRSSLMAEYVNRGTDMRVGGALGHVLAWIQRTLSFHSETPPFSCVARWGTSPRRYKVGLEWSRPWLLPFFLLFIPHCRVRDRPRWYSFRAGWRFDENWGRGGYVADVIVKLGVDNLVE